MRQAAPFAAAHTRTLAQLLHHILNQDQFPVILDADEIEQAMPAILRALNVQIVKHTCNRGAGPRFGRLATPGTCPRCDELHAGEAPREAPAAVRATAGRRRDNTGGYPTTSEINDHFAPGGQHATGQCAPVCTFGDH